MFMRLFKVLHDNEVDALQINAGRLKYVEPLGICLLAIFLKLAEERQIKVAALDIDERLEGFLNRMEFFSSLPNLSYSKQTEKRAFASTTALMELQVLNKESQVENVANLIAEAIIQGINIFSKEDDGMRCSPSEMAQANVAYIFNEILSNSLTHGQNRGFKNSWAAAAAMYYSETHEIVISIVDNGCGLLETLKGHSKMSDPTSHRAAIELALQPGVSCNKDLGVFYDTKNQGIGLTVCTELATRSGGSFSLFTGDACLRSGESPISVLREIDFWQGAGVSFRLNCKNLADLSVPQILKSIPGYQPVPGLNFVSTK